MERETGRPRGFGFITFAEHRSMDDAIKEMHGKELGDRAISVNKAQPRKGEGDDLDSGYQRGYPSNNGRGSYGGIRERTTGQDECFKCGRSGHWARDCPSAGGGGRGGGSDMFSMRPRFGGDRFGGDRDRFIDDRYDGGRYGDRERFDSRDRYTSRDRFASDRYQQPAGDRFGADKYGGSDRYAPDTYGRDRGYDRDFGPRGGGDRYGNGGPGRVDRSFRNRPAPYDRPARGGRPSTYDRY
ncbi:hypothetical protein ACFE04_002324 [Oxalis oulophora]